MSRPTDRSSSGCKVVVSRSRSDYMTIDPFDFTVSCAAWSYVTVDLMLREIQSTPRILDLSIDGSEDNLLTYLMSGLCKRNMRRIVDVVRNTNGTRSFVTKQAVSASLRVRKVCCTQCSSSTSVTAYIGQSSTHTGCRDAHICVPGVDLAQDLLRMMPPARSPWSFVVAYTPVMATNKIEWLIDKVVVETYMDTMSSAPRGWKGSCGSFTRDGFFKPSATITPHRLVTICCLADAIKSAYLREESVKVPSLLHWLIRFGIDLWIKYCGHLSAVHGAMHAEDSDLASLIMQYSGIVEKARTRCEQACAHLDILRSEASSCERFQTFLHKHGVSLTQ